MFCPLEQIELRTSTCVVNGCMYKGSAGSCEYDKLAEARNLSTSEIAEIKQVKMYKVKAWSNTARQNIEIGLIVDRYSEYVKDSFPVSEVTKQEEMSRNIQSKEENSNDKTEDISATLLRRVFGLSDFQQQQFWDEERFNQWCRRNNVTVSLKDISQVLKSIPFLPQF